MNQSEVHPITLRVRGDRRSPASRTGRAMRISAHSEIQRLRSDMARLLQRVTTLESEGRDLRAERDAALRELDRVTASMIFKEDLIEGLRHQVRRMER